MVKVVKNIPKGNSYALAHRLMKSAIDHNFPLQAITIQESILADRLWSTLNAHKAKPQKPGTLGKALIEWVPQKRGQTVNANAGLFDQEMVALKPALDKWWDNRNKVLHGIVKSPQGKAPEVGATSFETFAQQVARDGQDLVRRVSNWSKKQIRRDLKKNNEDKGE